MQKKPFPKQKINIFKDLGVALVAIGMGIGSGEFILWPYLSVSYGYGILWLALLGLSFQVILNLELQRYAVVSGRNAVEGLLSVSRFFSVWLIISTLIGFGWPGFIASSTYLLSAGLGSPESNKWLLYVLFVVAILILTVNRKVYSEVERIFKIVLPFSFFIVFIIFIKYFDFEAFRSLLFGVIGIGNSYLFIPKGVDLFVLLGAFVYAGSGGNLLLGQTFYSIVKKQGMAKYGENKVIAKEDIKSLKEFSILRRFQKLENVFVFGGLGLLTILMLSYLGPILIGVDSNISSDLNFLVQQSELIRRDMGRVFSFGFIFSGAFALFGVQIGVFDTVGRIVAQIFNQKEGGIAYKSSIFIQGVIGILLLVAGIDEPLWLLNIGAVGNSLSMAAIAFFVRFILIKELPMSYRPNKIIQMILVLIGFIYFIFFGFTIAHILGVN